jgi:pimeloyl-ACP methyl ester carboxylesterase
MAVAGNAAVTSAARPRRERGRIFLFFLLALLVVLGWYAWYRPLSVMRGAGRVALWCGGIRGHYAQVGLYRVHYYEGGQGRPLVFVHGLGAESLDWVPAMLHLRGQFHVYAVDLLGHGWSDKPDIAYSVAQQTEMLHQFLADRNAQPADVVGISMGGWVTLKLAADHPESVNRLVVADPAGLKFKTHLTVKNFLPSTREEFATFMTMLTPRQYYVPYPVRRDFLRKIADNEWLTRRIFDSIFTYQDVLDGKLQEIKAPVLIIWGREEHMIPIAVGEEMKQQLPNSSLLVCADSGHLALYECWKQLKPGVTEFLTAPQPPVAYVREVATGETVR